MMFYVSKFLFPLSREFSTLEEFLTDNADKLNTRGSRYEVLAFLTDVPALEQSFDYGSTSRRTTNTVFFHGVT